VNPGLVAVLCAIGAAVLLWLAAKGAKR